jgi:hypothetical protein
LSVEFQAFLSWFSRKRLLLDRCEIVGKPMARDFYRHCVIAQAADQLIGEAAMLS